MSYHSSNDVCYSRQLPSWTMRLTYHNCVPTTTKIQWMRTRSTVLWSQSKISGCILGLTEYNLWEDMLTEIWLWVGVRLKWNMSQKERIIYWLEQSDLIPVRINFINLDVVSKKQAHSEHQCTALYTIVCTTVIALCIYSLLGVIQGYSGHFITVTTQEVWNHFKLNSYGQDTCNKFKKLKTKSQIIKFIPWKRYLF